ncbi:hypothetical protein Tcan_00488, partial [Toxocara canis]
HTMLSSKRLARITFVNAVIKTTEIEHNTIFAIQGASYMMRRQRQNFENLPTRQHHNRADSQQHHQTNDKSPPTYHSNASERNECTKLQTYLLIRALNIKERPYLCRTHIKQYGYENNGRNSKKQKLDWNRQVSAASISRKLGRI